MPTQITVTLSTCEKRPTHYSTISIKHAHIFIDSFPENTNKYMHIAKYVITRCQGTIYLDIQLTINIIFPTCLNYSECF